MYKKQYEELKKLVDKYGYWSNEVLEYNHSIDYHISKVINHRVQQYLKGRI